MKKRIGAMLMLALLFLSACAPGGPGEGKEPVVQTISAAEAKAMMDEGQPYILLDVRTEEEFREERIEGAMLIPDTEIAAWAEKELPDKEALILLYCRSGRRSALAAQVLADLGYTNIYDFGGIIDWPYETVGG